MNDLRKIKFNNSVWVPLRARKRISDTSNLEKCGDSEEFIGHASIMFPIDQKLKAEKLRWVDFEITQNHTPDFYD